LLEEQKKLGQTKVLKGENESLRGIKKKVGEKQKTTDERRDEAGSLLRTKGISRGAHDGLWVNISREKSSQWKSGLHLSE